MIWYRVGIAAASIAFGDTVRGSSYHTPSLLVLTPETSSIARRFASDLVAELGLSFPADRTWMLLTLESGLRVEMSVFNDGNHIRFSSELAEGRVSGRLMRKLLEANFLKRGTDGATVGWRDGGPLLQLLINLTGVSYEQFKSTVEDFFNISDRWFSACVKDADDAENALAENETSPQDSAFVYFHP